MDFINIIQGRIKNGLNERLKVISSVIIHIEREFTYFENGINESDEYYFNYIIYKTNQAFTFS